jgi:AcrR family transcriptional regulator
MGTTKNGLAMRYKVRYLSATWCASPRPWAGLSLSRWKEGLVGTGTRRMPAEERKKQIVQVALETVDKHGLHGTTMARIAKGAGVTQAALYTHFASREQILLAVLDAIYEEIARIQETANKENVVEGLREATQTYSRLVGGQRTIGHAHLLLEFVTSSREFGLRDALKHHQLTAARQLSEIIANGKDRKGIPENVDSEQLAWMVTGWSWALDMAQLMGLRSVWHPGVSARLLDAIIDSIAKP